MFTCATLPLALWKRSRLLLLPLLLFMSWTDAVHAATQLTLSGDQRQGPIVANQDGRFSFPNIPLRRNSVNTFTVTARDDAGRSVSRNVSITQIALDSVVVSKIKAERLSVQEVEQLVNDGVIKLDDPANFNVSKFEIVLAIGREEFPISIPVAVPIGEEPTGFETIPLPKGMGDGGGSPKPQDVEVIVFEQIIPGPPGEPSPPPFPGVIIIEGKLKSLKEFFSVRLLLMNVSGLFTLSDVKANIVFPNGGLSPMLPADGVAIFNDILPGTPDEPGQKEREFLIRGDEIGVRKVQVDFGGTLTGPGIPEDEPIPFNGSATTEVEVKGPPEFRVKVIHPPAVVQNVPYELTVDITNIGELPALYASLDLDVGADAQLVDCQVNQQTGAPSCTLIVGPARRNFGHLLPGSTTRQVFTVNPLTSGEITSCLGVADQNITLQVFVGNLGCLAGKRPPEKGQADGIPTVNVLPSPNVIGVGIDSPVTAFFSELMNTGTITTGQGGSFNVIDDAGDIVPGQLRFVTLSDHTVAIWQVNDGQTNRLRGNTTYSVALSAAIKDQQGFGLRAAWQSQFTTTDPTNDTTPPTLTLNIEPLVDPNRVVPGQLIQINAVAADQGSRVARVELRRQDTSVANAAFELIDQKAVFATSSGPCIFSVDSANLIPGHTYQFKATAFDHAGNAQDATIAAILAQSVAPPTIQLPQDPTQPMLHGISVTITPVAVSPGVTTVHYFLDNAAQPFKTVTLAPFSATLGTLGLALGSHTIRAQAIDGLDQTGQDTFGFTLAENRNEPSVNFVGVVDGARVVRGDQIIVSGNVSDPVGITSVQFFLDNPNGAPIAMDTQSFVLNTAALTTGAHQIFLVATNRLGVSNKATDPDSILDFQVVAVPNGSPPAAPTLNPLSAPVNGRVTVSGTTAPGARVDITNVAQNLKITVSANTAGAFSAAIDAASGDAIRVVAFDFTQSQQPSPAASATVPAPAALDRLEAAPISVSFTTLNATQNLTITGFFSDGSSADVTAQATFSSSSPSVASVSATGRITALVSGTTTITVQLQGKQTQVAVTVTIKTLTSIALSPAEFTLVGIGKTRQLTVTGIFSDNSTALITSGVTFSSGSINVATVSSSGVVTATGIGQATITATVSGVPSAQSTVTVEEKRPTELLVTPSSIEFTEAGQTVTLQVTARFNDGTTGPAGTATFSSRDTLVATVNTTGVVRAISNGSTTIDVTVGTLSATVPVVVNVVATAALPEITSIDRPRAGEGDAFVLRGKNFAATPAGNLVLLNGLRAEVQAARQDELIALTPKGAANGPVTVKVAGQTSNAVNLDIYPRKARNAQLTASVDAPATPNETLTLTLPDIDFRTGDAAFLSSAPDILAPLTFAGTLRARIDNGAFFAIAPSTTATDLTARFTPGTHLLTLELSEAGGRIQTGSIFLIHGPAGTGPLVGERSVIALKQSQPIPVTFINLKDANGNPLADGSKVAVSTLNGCFNRLSDGNCISSAEGSITNGEPSPDVGSGDQRMKVFTVQGGRIDVRYDPIEAGGVGSNNMTTTNVHVLPADTQGRRTTDRALTTTLVTLTSFDTAATPRSQSSVIADGLSKIVTVTLKSIRDTAGNLVPDGSKVAVSTLNGCFNRQPDGNCISSAEGVITNGEPSPDVGVDDQRMKVFTVQNGQVEAHYDPDGVTVATGSLATVQLAVLPALSSGHRVSDRSFTLVPITLSSASAQNAEVSVTPPSVLATGEDFRVVVTVSGIADALGTPVPDGTKVAVSTLNGCFNRLPDGNCISSAEGLIVNGEQSPDVGNGDNRMKTLTVSGGQVQAVYSAQGVAVQALQSATARLAFLPARPGGQRIGDRAFIMADITLTGYQTATATVNPLSVVADGLSKIVTITLSGIRDTVGNLVPDGAKIAVSTLNGCFNRQPDGNCISSAEGIIVNGVQSPDVGNGDNRMKVFTVQNGRVEVQYDPANVTVSAGNVATATIAVLPAQPNGRRVSDRSFLLASVTLSSVSAQQTNVGVSPPSVLATGEDFRVVVTVSGLVDVLGNAVPDGAKIAVSTLNGCFNRQPDGNCISSAEGIIVNGVQSPELGAGDNRIKILTVSGGQIQAVYSAQGVTIAALQSATTRLAFLPAQPNGQRIGDRSFIMAEVTLTSFQSADIAGAGSVAPNSLATYTVSNIRDTAGKIAPNGAKIAVSTIDGCFNRQPDGNCIGSAGGAIVNGVQSPELGGGDNRMKIFTVENGSISVTFQAPAQTGTSVLQLLPAQPNGSRIGDRAFVLKSVAITP